MAVKDRPHRVCILGASGKLGRYMVRHTLDHGYEVVGVCREQSIAKLDEFANRIELHGGATDDREVIEKAVAGCDGVLVVLVPWGMNHYASGTAQAVLDLAPRDARLVFSAGWWPSRDGHDVFPGLSNGRFCSGGSPDSRGSSISMTKSKPADGSMRVTHGGQSCGEAISRRAKAKAYPCGAVTLESRFWQVISLVGQTSRASWSRRWRMTN